MSKRTSPLLTGAATHVTFSGLCSSLPMPPRRQRSTNPPRRPYPHRSRNWDIQNVPVLT
jgi:hypothetical protein